MTLFLEFCFLTYFLGKSPFGDLFPTTEQAHLSFGNGKWKHDSWWKVGWWVTAEASPGTWQFCKSDLLYDGEFTMTLLESLVKVWPPRIWGYKGHFAWRTLAQTPTRWDPITQPLNVNGLMNGFDCFFLPLRSRHKWSYKPHKWSYIQVTGLITLTSDPSYKWSIGL